MKIYTKKGDAGETGLYGGARVPKDELRIAAYGTVDELNAVLGVVLSDADLPAKVRARLNRIQFELFQLGGELATPRGKSVPMELLGAKEIEQMETEIDAMEAELPELTNFILPAGSKSSSSLHLARTICRRGERTLVTLNRAEPLRDEVMQYINRLSDYLFVSARFANHLLGIKDVPWIAPPKKVSGTS
jgi:cob(I)alamin adenosyltransferase